MVWAFDSRNSHVEKCHNAILNSLLARRRAHTRFVPARLVINSSHEAAATHTGSDVVLLAETGEELPNLLPDVHHDVVVDARNTGQRALHHVAHALHPLLVPLQQTVQEGRLGVPLLLALELCERLELALVGLVGCTLRSRDEW